MSRARHFIRGLGSSYLSLGVTAIYTAVSVPVALHYLTKSEFGVWAVVVQVAAYLTMIDLGMTTSGVRMLMDYKDHPDDGQYGSFIKTAMLTQAVQAVAVLV